MKNVAVIDVGKTNAKLALVEAGTLREVAVVARPNRVLVGQPWPHFDLQGHWAFFLEHLADFHAAHQVDAISVTTHGAAAVLLDARGALAAPMLDYEHSGPDSLAEDYDAIRPDFELTGSPRLPMGLNLGAQLHWQLQDPDLSARVAHVLTYPGYWGWRLTGEMSCDVTSLGCHTDLWEPWNGRYSALVDCLGLRGKMAAPRRPAERLGTLLPALADATGLPATTPVSVGIHDSNASLYPYILNHAAPFAVVSTGTWVISMAVGGSETRLDPRRDVLLNVSALGDAVPSARFMGGREFDLLHEGAEDPNAADRAAVLTGIWLLPSVEPGAGPFAGRHMRWTAPPATGGQRMLALSWYLALMTRTCLDLIGACGPVIVEGPFARNPYYLEMLSAQCPDRVETAISATGTYAGAALLSVGRSVAPTIRPVSMPADSPALAAYAARWRELV